MMHFKSSDKKNIQDKKLKVMVVESLMAMKKTEFLHIIFRNQP